MSKSFERGLLVLRMIPREPRSVSSGEIKTRLETEYGIKIDIRTIQHDLASISQAYPLQRCDQDNTPGYCFPKNAPVELVPGHDDYTALSWFLVEQHLSLMLPMSMSSRLAPIFDTAKRFLQREGKVQYQEWLKRVKILPGSFRLIPPQINEAVQRTIYEALWLGECLDTYYISRSATEQKELTLHPQGLVIRNDVLYLIAKVDGYEDLRHFALHRIVKAELTYRNADMLASEKIEQYINSGAFSYPESGLIRLVIRVDADTGRHLTESKLDENQNHRVLPDGRTEIEATVLDSQQLLWWIRSFGAAIEVVEPRALRQKVLSQAQEVMSLYQ